MKKLNKLQISGLAIFQIIFIISLFKDFIVNNKLKEPARTTFFLMVVVFVGIIIICIYGYIIIKFWNIRERKVYKIFTVLNIIYLINEIINTFQILININITFMIIPNVIICIFLIINLILILTYNRNLRAIKKKEKPV